MLPKIVAIGSESIAGKTIVETNLDFFRLLNRTTGPIRNVEFRNFTVSQANLRDRTFTDCSLTNVCFEEPFCSQTTFESCQLNKFSVYSGNISGLKFVRSTGDKLTFHGLKMPKGMLDTHSTFTNLKFIEKE